MGLRRFIFRVLLVFQTPASFPVRHGDVCIGIWGAAALSPNS